jgi:hypothetical protein
MPTPPKLPPLQTITSLTHNYNAIRELYIASSFAIEIRQFINSHAWHVNKAIALGIGSVTAKRKGFFKDGRVEEDVSVNLFRLACFMDIAGFLDVHGSGAGQKICIRDRGFNELDVGFLKELGIEVAYRDIDVDGETFLFDASTFVGRAHGRSLLEGIGRQLPALYIGREVGLL